MEPERSSAIGVVALLVVLMVLAALVGELLGGCGDDAPAPVDALPSCAKLGCEDTALCNSDGSACYCAGERCEL